jgi:general secretion pathway protein K
MRTTTERGGALLAVLWLTAALSVISFTVASTVRAETERTSTITDGLRAYYLASGSIERAILWVFWGMYSGFRNPDGSPMYYEPPMPFLRYAYETGDVLVEVIPEAGKLNVNRATPEELNRLMIALGLSPERALQIAAGIVDYRTAVDANTPPSQGAGSSFQPRRASLEELEEILLIPGMTPDIFYGRYDHDPAGRLIPRGGLRDCLTVYGVQGTVDPNTASPALLESLGLSQQMVAAIIARRMAKPFKTDAEVAPFIQGAGPDAQKLRIGGQTIWTLRATAKLRIPGRAPSDLRRTVAATVKFLNPMQYNPPYHILRWYDDAWTPVGAAF